MNIPHTHYEEDDDDDDSWRGGLLTSAWFVCKSKKGSHSIFIS